jgi:cytochrome c553
MIVLLHDGNVETRSLPRSSVWVVMLSLAAMTTAAQQAPAAPAAGEYRPPPAPEQPLPYSHKTHLAQGLKCVMCHESVETDDHATLPPTATCMGCHANVRTDSPHIQKLKESDDKGETDSLAARLPSAEASCISATSSTSPTPRSPAIPVTATCRRWT